MNVQSHGYLGVSRVAARLNLSVDTVRMLFDKGVLTGIRTPAGYRLIDPASVDNHKTFLSVSGTARELDCSPETVRVWFDDGLLWGFRTPKGHRRIDPESVEAVRKTAESAPRRNAGPRE